MKHLYLLLFTVFFTFQIHAQQAPFITTWEVKPGYLSINIPTTGTGYNYTVDFGDGTILSNQTGNASHTYSAPGIYTISITGNFPRIYFSGNYYRNYILSVEQWGDVLWHSMRQAFMGCSNLVINATDAPNLSQVTDMSMMFMNTSSFNQPIDFWDVSNITDMQSMFQNAIAFNQPLSSWDVSNVVNMRGMFQGAANFNQQLNNWDVSNVINMERLFKDAISFNQPLNNWDVSNVTSIGSPINVTGGMFEGAISFNQPLDNWDVSNVIYMSRTFKDATSFNQPLDNWDVSSVTSMNYLFNNATSFNKPLNNWDTSAVTDMSYMFNGASTFNQSLNNWVTSGVYTMNSMFENAIAFNQPIQIWNVSNVSDMYQMFKGANSFDQPLNSWVFTNAVTTGMFVNAISFNQPLDNWGGQMNINYEMFYGASSFNQDLSGWTFHPFMSLSNFVSYSGLDISNYEALLTRFDQLGIQNGSLGAHGLLYCDDTSRNELINNKGWTIHGDATYVYCNDIDSFISQWEVTQSDLTITIPTTGSGYDYDIKFGDGTIQTNVTGNAIHTYTQPGTYTVKISGDFPRIYFNNSGDKDKIKKVLQWGAIEWQSMENAFSGCTNLVIDSIDTPDLSQVSDMSSMFAGATYFNSPLNQWVVSNVTDMSNMFNGVTTFNQRMDKWDVSNVTNMTNMFQEATFFNKDISTWNFNASVILSGFISNSGLNVTNYDELLARFEQLGLQNKTLDADSLFYCNTISRGELVNNLNWSIQGDNLYFHCSDIGAFITTWEVTADDLSITIPIVQSYLSPYNFKIDFGDGTVLSNVTENITHIYSQPGIYTVSITGDFPYIRFSTDKILSVEQWGNIQWKAMNNAFLVCTNLVINAVDAPDLSQVSNMSGMFRGATSFNQDINHWNVSNVTSMSYMFEGAISFNQPLDNWDVSNVNNMVNMFAGATSFNQPLNNWDVSNVTALSDMFSNAVYFNQDLSSWVFNTNASFGSLSSEGGFIFNSGLDAGNYTALLSRFATLGLQNKFLFARGMFYCDPNVRSTLINSLNWNIIEDRFLVDCNPIISPNAFVTIWEPSGFPYSITIPTSGSGYNYDIDFGDGTVLTNVTGSATHTYTQPGCYYVSITGDFPRIYFNDTGDKSKIIEIVQWGNIQWQSMEKAFSGCNNLRIYATDTPDLSQVTNMSYMFENVSKFNQNINNWDVSNITNMKWLFVGATIFNMPLNDWDVSNVTDMSEMFALASHFNRPLDNWDVSNVTDMSYMFAMIFNDRSSFNQNLNSWNVSSVTNMRGMFARANYFNHPLDNWDVSSVTDMGGMFINVRNFDFPLDNWDVSNVTDMSEMFAGARAFNQPLNDWDVSNVTNMFGMFKDARVFNQPLNNWNVSSVTKMFGMFEKALAFNQPLDNWNMSNVTTIGGMFQEAESFNQPLNDWDTSNVTSMYRVFQDAKVFNQPLNNWDVSNVNNMSNTFNNATLFNQDISSWNFNQSVFFSTGIPYVNQFLSGTAMDIPNYDALLARFVYLGLQNKTFGAHDLYYCNEDDRDYLITNLGWTISGDSISPDCNFINGSIVYDEDNDGCDINDIAVDGFMINVSNGTNDYSTFSSNGAYNFGVFGSSFTVSVINTPSYFTVTPATVPVTFTTSQTEIVDFCVTATQIIEDLNITLLPTGEARPGFEAVYRMVVRNVGTETIANVNAILDFDDTMQQFVSANPAPGTTTANTLTFPIGIMQPFQTLEIDFTMLTFQPPTVNGGDILNFTAEVTPVANDFTPNDNTYNLAQVVVNSFDPNDKQVLQGEELHIDEIDEYLDYLIRFQNTGTASAINVRILDTLHPKLDWSTLTPISASHDYYVKITDGNRVEFMFDNIHLPDSLSNEPESHGFVAYKIKPKNNVQVGDVISGDAAIYFDFNAPIITNMVHTLIVEPLSIPDVTNPLNRVVLYPNPTNKTLHIHLTDGIELQEVLIYDLQGKVVRKIQGKETTLDVENLRPGMYLLKITTNQGTINRQLIKN